MSQSVTPESGDDPGFQALPLGVSDAPPTSMRKIIGILVLMAPVVGSAAGTPSVEVVGRAELPPRVEAAFERQAGNAGIDHIRRSVDAHGRVTYSAKVAGTGHIVRIRGDGKILSP
jgi:hypothetical protein